MVPCGWLGLGQGTESGPVPTPKFALSRVSGQTLSNELELLIASATDYAICMLDRQGFVVIWNKGAERIFGWTENEVLGRHHSTFFPAGEIAAGTPDLHLTRALEQGSWRDRALRIRKDGSEFLASATLTSIRDEFGSEIGFGKVLRDITDDQAHADAIEAREMHLQSILATVPDAMVVIDEQGIIGLFSTAAERLFGYSQGEVLGQNVNLLMGSPDHEAHDDYLSRSRSTGERRIIGIGRRVIGRRKDGSAFPLDLAIGEASGGGQRVFTAFLRDLTEREEVEARLQKIQNELLHATRVSAMGAMASTLAHELNQPLTVVANYVQTSRNLLEAADETSIASVREALAIAEEEVLRAGEVIRRLREFVASGGTDKSVEPVSKLIEDSCLLGLAGARARGIVSHIDLAPEVGPVLIDHVQIQQVLINLIRNAVDAMAPEGSGEVLIASREDGEFVRLTVADTGPGLTAEVSERLFQAFVSTKPNGMGLGLSICRTIVEAHGGRIWYEPALGGGAAFNFTLPLAGVGGDQS